MSFFRDYFLPNGKRVEFWGPYNRALIPLFVAVTPFVVMDLAFGMRTIPFSPFFWPIFGAGGLLSAYVFSIGVMPWARRVTGKRKKVGKKAD